MENERISLSSLLEKEGEEIRRADDLLDRVGQDSESYERANEELDSMLIANKSRAFYN